MKSIFILISFFTLHAITPNAYAATTTPVTFLNQAETQTKVRTYFKDSPAMIEIARCESNFRQFTDSGTVLRGGSAGGMVGIFQFFESVHAVPAKALGFDLATVDGNLGYARHLHEAEGTTPWNPARSCWDVAQAKTLLNNPDRAKLMQHIVLLTKLISLLQKQLAA